MISIAMTTYNGERYVKKQIESLINQTINFDELIIVDDNSTDNTVNIINEIIQENKQLKIKLHINASNLGYKKNFKKAISLCSGDYIFLCDQDDIWYDSKLEKLTNLLKNNENIKLIASSFDLIDSQDNPLAFQPNPKKSNNNLVDCFVPDNGMIAIKLETLLKKNFSQGCTMAMKKDIMDQYIAHSLTILPHDWELAIIAACYDGCYFLNETLIHYRIHTHNTIGLDDVLADKKMQTRKQRIKNRDKILETESISGVVASKYKNDDYISIFNDYMQFRITMIRNKKPLKLIKNCFFGQYKSISNANAIAGDLCAILFYSLHKTSK